MNYQGKVVRNANPDVAPDVILRGDRITGDRYTSREFAKLEWDAVFKRTWHIGGRVSQLEEPGDFCIQDIGRESILMTRTPKGEIKAFYNWCPHRGNKLVMVDDGYLKKLSAPIMAGSSIRMARQSKRKTRRISRKGRQAAMPG